MMLFHYLRLYSVEWNSDKWMVVGKDLEGSSYGLILRFHPSIHLDGLRKTTKNISQDIWSLDLDLNLGPPEYEAGMLTTQPQRLVFSARMSIVETVLLNCQRVNQYHYTLNCGLKILSFWGQKNMVGRQSSWILWMNHNLLWFQFVSLLENAWWMCR
jgi:hypothetical protein